MRKRETRRDIQRQKRKEKERLIQKQIEKEKQIQKESTPHPMPIVAVGDLRDENWDPMLGITRG